MAGKSPRYRGDRLQAQDCRPKTAGSSLASGTGPVVENGLS